MNEPTEIRPASEAELALANAAIAAARAFLVHRLRYGPPEYIDIAAAMGAGKATMSLVMEFPSGALRCSARWPDALGDKPEELFRFVPERAPPARFENGGHDDE